MIDSSQTIQTFTYRNRSIYCCILKKKTQSVCCYNSQRNSNLSPPPATFGQLQASTLSSSPSLQCISNPNPTAFVVVVDDDDDDDVDEAVVVVVVVVVVELDERRSSTTLCLSSSSSSSFEAYRIRFNASASNNFCNSNICTR
jgi:hypothetical protein